MKPLLKKLVGIGLAIYCTMVAVVYVLCTIHAENRAGNTLSLASRQMAEDIRAAADGVIIYVGRSIVRGFPDPHDAKIGDLDLYYRLLSIDELTIVDDKGMVLISTEAKLKRGMDFDVSSKARSEDYSQLYGKVPWFVELPRSSKERPSVKRIYGAVAWPDGKGFVQIGLDERKLATDFGHYYSAIAVHRPIGEKGMFIIVNPLTDEVISTRNEADIGKQLSKMLERVRPSSRFGVADSKYGCWLMRDGVGEHCMVVDSYCNGHRILSVLPDADVTSDRDVAVLSIAALLFLAVVAVIFMIYQMIEKGRRVRAVMEREKEIVEKDLKMAKSIQTGSLPMVFPPYPDIADRLDIFAMMRTAKEVGGDFYDFYFVGIDHLAMIIADVSGKGVPAAMFMMRSKTILQMLLRGGMDVAEALAETNRRLCVGNASNMFVTAWVGVVDLTTGDVEYVNAGHNPPLVKRNDGSVEWLRNRSGVALAAMDGTTYKTGKLRLSLGDEILLYTDGITEAIDSASALFGEDRLESTMKRSQLGVRQLCNNVVQAVDDFADGAEQADDMTMLAIRLNGVEKGFRSTDDGMLKCHDYLEALFDSPRPQIIMDEVVSNIVRCSGATVFSMKVVSDEYGVTAMTFTDDGTQFDPTKIPDPDISASVEDRAIGGLGMFMVRKMSKSVNYERVNDHNVLTVVFSA